MPLSDAPLFTAEAIQRRVAQLAAEVSRDFAGRDPIAIIVLKGALHFGSDLTRQMNVPVTIDFIRAKSYAGTRSQGTVEILVPPSVPLQGRDVIIVEDILDTGRTATAIQERLLSEGPSSVAFCTLFDKPSRRELELKADYVGFTIEEDFVVGYGMDHDEQYRDLPEVYVLKTPE